jgi:hypothetical protein
MVNLTGKITWRGDPLDEAAQNREQRSVSASGLSCPTGSPGNAVSAGAVSRSLQQDEIAVNWIVSLARLMPWLAGFLCVAEVLGYVARYSPLQLGAVVCVVLIGCNCILMILVIIRALVATGQEATTRYLLSSYRQNVGQLLICMLLAGTDLILRLHLINNMYVMMGVSVILANAAIAAAHPCSGKRDDQRHRSTRPPIGVY